jgi:hypothetical protein
LQVAYVPREPGKLLRVCLHQALQTDAQNHIDAVSFSSELVNRHISGAADRRGMTALVCLGMQSVLQEPPYDTRLETICNNKRKPWHHARA